MKERPDIRKLPYTTTVNASDSIAARRWCESTFGRRWSILNNLSGRWMMKWSGDSDTFIFQFAEEPDRNWFILRWGA